MALLIFVLLVSGISQAQVISPPPIAPNSVGSQLPAEVLARLIGKYLTMMQQYQMMVTQGQNPDSAIKLRITASIDVSSLDSENNTNLEPVLTDVSKIVFWVNANLFSKYPSTFAVNFSGIFGNIEVLSNGTILTVVSHDESVFSVLPGDYGINSVLSQLSVADDVSMSLQDMQNLISSILPSLGIQYEGLKSTPRGMAHVINLSSVDNDMVIILWVLDKTWDLCKVDFFDTVSNSVATIVINQIDLVTSVPGSEFTIDTANLAEIRYDDLIELLTIKVVSVALSGVPVVADLYTSSPTVRQGENVEVISNALDAEDAESELIPSIEYKAPNGTWELLKAEYIGVSPLGSWKAIFAPSFADSPGSYDLRVVYADKSGNTSDSFELKGAIKVIAIPPYIVSFIPKSKEQNVLVSSPISVTFSQEMDKASVESGFSLDDTSKTSVLGTFDWSGNSLVFKPQDKLKYAISYTVRIAGTAKSISAVALDANMNGISEGSPKDDFVWTFSTETVPALAVIIKPANENVIKGNTIDVDLVAENMARLGSFKFDISFDPKIMNVMNVRPASFANWRPRPKDISESDLWLPVIIDNDKGKVTLEVSMTRTDGVTGTGLLAAITFEAIGIGESSIDFQNVSLKSILDEIITPELLNAKLAVTEFNIYDINKDGVVDIFDFMEAKPEGKADINGDGVVDILDIVASMGTGRDLNLWDANGDGIVDIHDFVMIQNDNGINPDANGDGIVDILDIVYLMGGAKGAPATILVNELGVSFPNPTNPEVWIPFKLAESNDVVVRIYSTKGQLVRTLDLGYRNPGNYTTRATAVYWDGKDENGQHVSSGIYFYNIKAGSFTATKKMIVLK